MRIRKLVLTTSERITLEQGHKNHSKFHFRKRCHVLLLCDAGWPIKDVAKMYGIRTRTIYTWMDRWRDMGIVGLGILSGRGLKAKLVEFDKETLDRVKKKFENQHAV